MLFIFIPIAIALAGLQFFLFGNAGPSPDTIAYMEIADQIAKVGYSHAITGHWSPLFSVLLFAVNKVFHVTIEQENTMSILVYAVLLIAGVLASYFFHDSLRRTIVAGEPDRKRDWDAWVFCGMGFTVYFLFSIHKITLRLPDGFAFIAKLMLILFLCRALQSRLRLSWVFAAGLIGGLSYLTRANLLYWSVGAGGLACIVLGGGVSWSRRVAAMAVFVLGVAVFTLPQIGVLSKQKGELSLGAGMIPLAEVYGVRWPDGGSPWPEKAADGDVRIFQSSRTVHYPGFYEPEREYEGATLLFSFPKMIRGGLRAAQSLLFGFWSSTYALLWPLLIAFLPAIFFGVRFRRAESIFLVVCGAAGVATHFFSFCIGYYLGAYLVMFFAGLSIAMLDSKTAEESRRLEARALFVTGLIFVMASFLTTLSYFREASRRGITQGNTEMANLVQELKGMPSQEGGLTRLAVAGEWLGLYAVRLSGTQVYAEIQNTGIFHDRTRTARVIEALKARHIQALLVPNGSWEGLEGLSLKPIKGTRWMRVDL